MKPGDAEWRWYEGEPSPLERVVIYCRTCKSTVMGFHQTCWREIRYEDMAYAREIDFYYFGMCYCCWNEKEKEGTLDDEEEGDK